MAVLMVLMLLSILLVKISELLFRLIARVDFDESRSTRHTGLVGALRKKEIIKAGRSRRRGKRVQANRKAGTGNMSSGSATTPQAFHGSPRLLRTSFGDGHEAGYLSPAHRAVRPYGVDGEDESEEIMTAFKSRPQSTAYGPLYHEAGYVPPGSYAAAQQPPPGDFQVVRGGRAADTSPYTMAQMLPPGAAPPTITPRQHSFISEASGMPPGRSSHPPMERTRASSQSALVEEIPSSPTSPRRQRRLSAFEMPNHPEAGNFDRRRSAPLPLSPSTFPSGAPISASATRPAMPRELSVSQPQPWRRESSTGSGFFSSLFRGTTKSEENEDSWSDSDESDDAQQRTNAIRRRWLFGKGKGKGTTAEAGVREEAEQHERDPDWEEALMEDDEEGDVEDADLAPTGKGFHVVRKPMPGSRPSNE